MTKKEQRVYLRVRRTEKDYLVTACDENLLGETLIDGEVELYVNERFFGGDLVTINHCLEEMKKATNCNLIGSEIVNAAVENRIVSDLAVMWLECKKNGRIGHVMLLR